MITSVHFTERLPVQGLQPGEQTFYADSGWLIVEPEPGRLNLTHEGRELSFTLDGFAYALVHSKPAVEASPPPPAPLASTAGSGGRRKK